MLSARNVNRQNGPFEARMTRSSARRWSALAGEKPDTAMPRVGLPRTTDRRIELSNQLPLKGIHYGFQAVVSSQLLIDVMKMVAHGLGADLQGASDILRILAFSE